MSHLRVSDIIYSDVIDSFISEILKYESSVIVSSTDKFLAVLFTHWKMESYKGFGRGRLVRGGVCEGPV